MEFFIYLLVAALFGLIPAKIAKSKGYSFGKWWIYGFLIFIVAIIHVCVLKTKTTVTTTAESKETEKIKNGSLDTGTIKADSKKTQIKGIAAIGLIVGVFVIGIIMLVAALGGFGSGKLSTEKLAKHVQENMLQQWEENGLDVKITKDLTLVKKGGNEYLGLVTISAFGLSQQITVNVIYDGKSFSWEIEGF